MSQKYSIQQNYQQMKKENIVKYGFTFQEKKRLGFLSR